jgi:hypothetical protein
MLGAIFGPVKAVGGASHFNQTIIRDLEPLRLGGVVTPPESICFLDQVVAGSERVCTLFTNHRKVAEVCLWTFVKADFAAQTFGAGDNDVTLIGVQSVEPVESATRRRDALAVMVQPA